MFCRALSLLILALFVAGNVRAQGDLVDERESLKGIESFSVDVTIEGPDHLVSADEVRRDVIAHRILHRLQEAGLRVQQADDAVPNLHVHLNMLELDRGLIPFAISAGFYQQVRVLDNGSEMAAGTWRESVLGLVSLELLSTIPQSVDNLVDQFIKDYRLTNE